MPTILRLLLVMFLVALSPTAQAKTTQPVAVTAAENQATAKAEIQQAFATWLKAVSTGSSDAVVKLYAKHAVLLPTISPVVANSPALRKAYFDDFTAKPELKGTVGEEHIRVFGNTAVNSGLYTFTYKDGDNTVSVPARFSFVYRKTPQGWLIIDHHSSKLP